MDKYLSIITNFGCHYKCPYCIVRNNGIKVPTTTLDGLDALEDAIKENGANIVSVSGGGDPLHNYTNHVDYYSRLFSILEKEHISMEMHTSYTHSLFPYEKCKRVVYHLNDINQLFCIKRFGSEIIRVVFVVTEQTTKEMVNFIAGFCKGSEVIDELSFRQMVDANYTEKFYLHDFLKNGHGKYWYYIEQRDYNLYFVNGKVFSRFMDIC